jgi:hypothetical protein
MRSVSFREIYSSYFRKLVPQIILFLDIYFCSIEVHFVPRRIAFCFFIQKYLFLLFFKNSFTNYFVPWCLFLFPVKFIFVPDVQRFVSLFIEICSSYFRKLVPQIILFLDVYFCFLEVHFVPRRLAFCFFIQKDLFLLFFKIVLQIILFSDVYLCSLWSSFLFPDVQCFVSLFIEICSSYFRKLVPQIILFLVKFIFVLGRIEFYFFLREICSSYFRKLVSQIILFLDIYFCSLWSSFCS